MNFNDHLYFSFFYYNKKVLYKTQIINNLAKYLFIFNSLRIMCQLMLEIFLYFEAIQNLTLTL